MADNVAITAGSGTSVAADDIASVYYQRVKLSLGADGTAVDAVAGAGAVSTGVQRVTLASDDPLVALVGSSDAQLPTTLGSTTSAASLSVTLASDEGLKNTVFAEDVASTAADKGVAVLAVRQDTDASMVGTSGDYTNLQVNATGFLKVAEMDSISFTPASVTSATTIFTQDMTGYESLSVQITSIGSGNTITFEASEDNSTWVSCSGLLSTGTSATSSAATAVSAVGLSRIPRWGRYLRARVSTYSSGTVTAFYSLSKAPLQSVMPVAAGNVVVAGITAHDAVLSGNPLRVAGRAVTANYTAVSSGDVSDMITTLVGSQIIKPYSIPEADWSYAAATGGISNTTTAVTVKAAAAAGLRNYITGLQVSSDALGAATELAIRDGAAGTVLWRLKVGTAGILSYHIGFATPLQGTAATLLEVVTLTASVTGGVFINMQGYVAP